MPYACTTYLYAPLATIYSFKMDADEAAAWNAVQKGIGGSGGTASAGDYGVLGGMHVKRDHQLDLADLLVATRQDAPNNFPGSKAGMTANVQGPGAIMLRVRHITRPRARLQRRWSSVLIHSWKLPPAVSLQGCRATV